MLNKYPRIKDLGDPDTVGMDQVTSDFRDMDQDQVIAVINWCRRFFGFPGGGSFIELKPGSTFTHRGRIVQGDLSDFTDAGATPPTSPTKPTSSSGGGKTINIQTDVVGRSKNGKKTGSGGVNINENGITDGDGNPIDLD